MVAELLAVIIGNSLNKVLNGCQESFNDPPYFAGAFVGSLAKQEKTTFTLCKCHQNGASFTAFNGISLPITKA